MHLDASLGTRGIGADPGLKVISGSAVVETRVHGGEAWVASVDAPWGHATQFGAGAVVADERATAVTLVE